MDQTTLQASRVRCSGLHPHHRPSWPRGIRLAKGPLADLDPWLLQAVKLIMIALILTRATGSLETEAVVLEEDPVDLAMAVGMVVEIPPTVVSNRAVSLLVDSWEPFLKLSFE